MLPWGIVETGFRNPSGYSRQKTCVRCRSDVIKTTEMEVSVGLRPAKSGISDDGWTKPGE